MCDGHGSDGQFINLEAGDRRGRRTLNTMKSQYTIFFQRDIKVFLHAVLP